MWGRGGTIRYLRRLAVDLRDGYRLLGGVFQVVRDDHLETAGGGKKKQETNTGEVYARTQQTVRGVRRVKGQQQRRVHAAIPMRVDEGKKRGMEEAFSR